MAELSEERKAQFQNFNKSVEADLFGILRSEKGRFNSVEEFIKRYNSIVERVIDIGTDHLNAFHEAHNELVTALTLLEDKSDPKIIVLDYEPTIDRCESRFDFIATMTDGTTCYIEIKTIHPMSQDDWEKYKKAINNDLIPNNVGLLLEEEWLGGELYHNTYASRSKMLDYTLDMEDKIHKCIGEGNHGRTFLVYFTNGFHWHLDEFEDFIYYYRNGNHFPGDPFALMEDHHVKEKNIVFKKNIDCFSFFRRPKLDMRPSKIIWCVNEPKLPH